MAFESLRDALPEGARDIALNLGMLADDEQLTAQQKWGCFLASAVAARNPAVLRMISAEVVPHLSPEAVQAAKSAAIIMGMNNIYYRFVHLASNETYRTLPAKLRMNVIANPGVDKTDFEMWSLAVSAINGCGACVDAHEHHLVKAGLPAEAIQTSIRIAAVVHAAAVALGDDGSPV